MFVLIIGCGRSGSELAGYLSMKGNDVVVIDRDEEKFENLSPEYTGFTVLGDATERDILEEAKIKNADVVVVTTDNDNINYMIARITQDIYGVNKILVRVIDPLKGVIYQRMKVQTFSPINLLVKELNRSIIEGSRGED